MEKFLSMSDYYSFTGPISYLKKVIKTSIEINFLF